MPFELNDNVHMGRAEGGQVLTLDHFTEPVLAAGDAALGAGGPAARTPQALAAQYLRDVAPVYGFDAAMLPAASSGSNGLAAPQQAPDGALELVDEKEILGTTVLSYQQTYQGLPVWEGGVSVTVQDNPMRVTASQSSVHTGLAAAGPEGPSLAERAAARKATVPTEDLRAALGLKARGPKLTVTSTRRLIYAYDPATRVDPESRATGGPLEQGPPTLPLPPVPAQLEAGRHYTVVEVLFSLDTGAAAGPVNWRAFVEEATGAVVYLRAFVACATGMVFRTDPLTAGSAVPPTGAAAQLNVLRSTVPLDGLVGGTPQPLTGAYVKIVDSQAPVALPPLGPGGPSTNFAYDAKAREFAAVNAYHHCDWLFRYMAGMGFDLTTYFDGTSFPVPVDAAALGDAINAQAPGNGSGTGSGGFVFGLAGSPFPAVSIAADRRVVLHEFGHTLLWDSVHSPNFGFAHSAGDSLAAVYSDPESSLRTDPVRRFETFPWILPNRNHGRDVAAGWAWGGTNDVGSYSSEQILSTTMFRLYRSLGGDSNDVQRRRLAARQTMYLIYRAIGTLASNPVTPTPKADSFATALRNADVGTANFEGYRGGAFHKVIRWAFEKQGLFQPPGAPTPVTTPGAPPAVDVYVNDGRNGEYGYQAVHWENTEIWNRRSATPGAGPSAHQTPVVGRVNHAYVRVRNRGTKAAGSVVVRGYSADPGAGLSWPTDWTPMLTAQIAVPGTIPPGGSVVVGPFRWKPQVVGHECMFMEVSAPGDRSNIDPATAFPCANGPTPEWRLVPYDNNLAQRNVAPVPGGGGVKGLLSAFLERTFLVRNPAKETGRVLVRAELPDLLARRGWSVRLDRTIGKAAFALAPGAERRVAVSLEPGKDFSAEDVKAAKGAAIRISVLIGGELVGGMTYRLDPAMAVAPPEKRGLKPIRLDDPRIAALLPDDADDADDADDEEKPVRRARSGDGEALLARVGIDGLRGAGRVTVRETTVELELD